MRRIQSPSSIITYKQCARKYYYQYILQLPVKENLYQIRGNIAHKVLEDFFLHGLIEEADYKTELQRRILRLLKLTWDNYYGKMAGVANIDEVETAFYETQLMLLNWLGHFIRKMDVEAKQIGVPDAFRKLTPITERQFVSENLGVKGFIDAIENYDGIIHILDYKTSKYLEITDMNHLQLAIYALLYREVHGKNPDKVGIFFLSQTEHLIEVTEALLEEAKMAIEDTHKKTESNKLEDYSMNLTPLCKWASGQCDFYGKCFNEKNSN